MIEEMNTNPVAFDPTHNPTREQILEHGFYYYSLSEKERVFYELALVSEGLQHEMALLKAKIGYFALINPLSLHTIVSAINALKGLMKVHYSIFKRDQAVDIDRKMGDFINSIGLPNDKLKEYWDATHGISS